VKKKIKQTKGVIKRKKTRAHGECHGGKSVNKGIICMKSMKSMKSTESMKSVKKKILKIKRSDVHEVHEVDESTKSMKKNLWKGAICTRTELQDQQARRKHFAAEGGSAEGSGTAADSDREDCEQQTNHEDLL
jgi:hypothetical protein